MPPLPAWTCGRGQIRGEDLCGDFRLCLCMRTKWLREDRSGPWGSVAGPDPGFLTVRLEPALSSPWGAWALLPCPPQSAKAVSGHNSELLPGAEWHLPQCLFPFTLFPANHGTCRPSSGGLVPGSPSWGLQEGSVLICLAQSSCEPYHGQWL